MDEEHIIIDISDFIDSSVTIDSSSIIGTNFDNIVIDSGIQWNTVDISYINQEWKNSFPEFEKVQDMCKDYPALEKAYENFKTVYKMVEQDWIGKQKSDQQSLF